MSNKIQPPTKFTQEIKDKWLEALKSGKYIQGYSELETIRPDEIKCHCCLGVLGEITEGLSNNSSIEEESPYYFLGKTIGELLKQNLYKTNDEIIIKFRPLDYKDDYSNVIPLIEALEVQE